MEEGPSQCVYIARAPFGVAKIILMSFLFAAISFATTLYFSRQIIIDDWEVYKCEPIITTSAEMFGKSSSDTVQECANRTYKCASPKIVKPVAGVFDSMTAAFGDVDFLVGDLDKLSGGATNMFTSQINNMMEKLKKGTSAVKYIVQKIMALFKRLISSMVVLLYSVYAMLQGMLATVHDKQLHNLIDQAITLDNALG